MRVDAAAWRRRVFVKLLLLCAPMLPDLAFGCFGLQHTVSKPLVNHQQPCAARGWIALGLPLLSLLLRGGAPSQVRKHLREAGGVVV